MVRPEKSAAASVSGTFLIQSQSGSEKVPGEAPLVVERRKLSTPFLKRSFDRRSPRRRSRSREAISQWCRTASRTADTAGTRCARPATSSTSGRDNPIASALRPSLQYRSGNQIFHAARASADSLITHQRSESPDWLLKNELSFKARRSALRGRDGETSGAL